jgi:hypothetical protein
MIRRNHTILDDEYCAIAFRDEKSGSVVTLPVGTRYKYALGAEWQAAEIYNIRMNYELAWIGDMPIYQIAA